MWWVISFFCKGPDCKRNFKLPFIKRGTSWIYNRTFVILSSDQSCEIHCRLQQDLCDTILWSIMSNILSITTGPLWYYPLINHMKYIVDYNRTFVISYSDQSCQIYCRLQQELCDICLWSIIWNFILSIYLMFSCSQYKMGKSLSSKIICFQIYKHWYHCESGIGIFAMEGLLKLSLQSCYIWCCCW